MRKLLVIALLLLAPSTSLAAFAVPFNATSTNTNWISPNAVNGIQQIIRGISYIATSTTQASVFPYASTTALSAATICLTSDICRSTWPTGGGGGVGTSTEPFMAKYYVATSTSQASLFPYASTTALSAADIFDSNLTAGRVVYATTSGQLAGSSKLTFDGSTFTSNGFTTITGTAASGMLGIGVGPQLNTLVYLQNGGGEALTSGSRTGYSGIINNTPLSASNAQIRAANFAPAWGGTANSPSGILQGVSASVSASPGLAGVLGRAEGVDFLTFNNSLGTVTNMAGGRFDISNQGGGFITNAKSGFFTLLNNNFSTTTNGYMMYAQQPTISSGELTNLYGLYLENMTGAATLNYAIYSAGGQSYHAGKFGIATTTPTSNLSVSSSAQQVGTLPLFTVASTTNATLFTVLGNGLVGIGTTSPITQLTLNGTGAANGITFGGNPNTNIYQNGTHVKTDAPLDSALGITGNNLFATAIGSVIGGSTAGTGNPGLTVKSSNDARVPLVVMRNSASMTAGLTEWRDESNNVLSIVDKSGNFGIGTTSPFAKLSVAGDAYIGGNLTATGTLTVANLPQFYVLYGGAGGVVTSSTSLQFNGTNLVFDPLADSATNFLIKGLTKGFRIGTNSASAQMEAVDRTGVGSYQPFLLGGSELRLATAGVEKLRLTANGGLSLGAAYLATDSGAGNMIMTGSLGIGTTTPGSILSVGNTNGINFSTATSSFSSTGGINLAAGCFAIRGTCIGGGGTGTVTAVSVASANGFAGSSSGGATPALTLTTTATGLLQGNGTAISGIGGTLGQFPYYNGTNVLTATSSILLAASGNVGLGSTTPSYRLSIGTSGSLYGSIVTTENKLATTTSMIVDWSQSNQQLIQIGTAATSIGFSNVINGATLRLIVCNPNATAGAVSFTGVEWSGGSFPTQTTTASVCDAWSFIATQATSTTGTSRIFGAMSPNFP